MTEAKFILSKKVLVNQVKKLKNLGFEISYSYKTNKDVGNVLQALNQDIFFSIHAREEINMIDDKNKIWFFTQAELEEDLMGILDQGVKNFIVDNEIDLRRLLKVIKIKDKKINLGLRMKFKEHRIGTGKYFVYGMPCVKINEFIKEIRGNVFIDNFGIHIHRKSQNTSEWEITNELRDSLTKENLEKIDFVNFGGGLPVEYRNHSSKVLPYIFEQLKKAKSFLDNYSIKSYIESGRFLAAPCIKLETRVIQIYNGNLVLNTTIYNCALDTLIGQHKMLVEAELEDNKTGEFFLIKGNSPTRDDIFRYKVKLKKDISVGDKVIFLNAGAYNYSTDFFGYVKLKTQIVEDF